MHTINSKREAVLATLSLLLTIVLYGVLVHGVAHKVYDSYFFPNRGPFHGGLMYLGTLAIVFYGLMLYHVCLIGNYRRRLREPVPEFDEVATLYDRPAPPLTVLIPSYKEERIVVWQTMMSAALSEYPAKRVVLLIDNPPEPKLAADRFQLEQARALPRDLQTEFARQAAPYHAARDTYLERAAQGISIPAQEMPILADLYEGAAQWLEREAQQFALGADVETLGFDSRFFVKTILLKPAALHRAQAAHLRHGAPLDAAAVARHYARLSGLFTVEFASFERKRYANLSHDPNKAMNLNSYMMLIGKSWQEIETVHGLQLRECDAEEASFTVPAATYVNTIDADSLMTHDYIARLAHYLEQPQHARVAVAQAPCSSIPGSAVAIERIAGACIDVQFHTHQGYTHWNASFWVGANAMLRMTALEAVKEVHKVDGKTIAIYIQDRTVIEDTESTIDLVHKGWSLYNYPLRMTYSATPADFGSLLIQRRRWANGGLIILPKLLRYAFFARKDLRLAKEFFMRFNYLAMTTLGVGVLLLYTFYTFSPRLSSPMMLYANLPVMLLYARDLKVCGYRYTDVLRVCALNLMLLPVITAGVLKQMEQIITGRKVPFKRTPKVKDRTSAPVLYYVAELVFTGYYAYNVLHYAGLHQWAQVGYASFSFALLSYALVYFIGIPALLQDIAAGCGRFLRLIQRPVLLQTETSR